MTAQGIVKRNIVEEAWILALYLSKYAKIERKFKEYKVEWISEDPGIYYPAMVHDFCTNYTATLDQYPKAPKGEIIWLLEVLVWGVIVDISHRMINMILFGPDYVPPP